MARQTISARFDSLQQAERAATEVRSSLDTHVDIRSLSLNQSDNGEDFTDVPGIFAFPSLSFGSSTPYVSAFPPDHSGFGEGGGAYSKHAYVLEASVELESEQVVTEIVERYDGELI